MNNTATLGQITKLLSLLEGVPSKNVQKALESGLFASVIRKGDLDEAKKSMEQDKLKAAWNLIGRLTKFKGIIITVPHDPCEHRHHEGNVYQLRCWEGKIGYPKRGHIDGGVDLFEVMLPAQLQECDCCWKETLSNLGINVHRSDSFEGEWVKEICTAKDGSKYNQITFKPGSEAQ